MGWLKKVLGITDPEPPSGGATDLELWDFVEYRDPIGNGPSGMSVISIRVGFDGCPVYTCRYYDGGFNDEVFRREELRLVRKGKK